MWPKEPRVFIWEPDFPRGRDILGRGRVPANCEIYRGQPASGKAIRHVAAAMRPVAVSPANA